MVIPPARRARTTRSARTQRAVAWSSSAEDASALPPKVSIASAPWPAAGSDTSATFCYRIRRGNGVSLLLERFAQVVDQRGVVVDEQDAGGQRHSFSTTSSNLPVWKGLGK